MTHSDALFGLDPLWGSIILLAVTYATLLSERVNRAIVALLAASVAILVGLISQEDAIAGVDFNTIALLESQGFSNTSQSVARSSSEPVR